MENTNTDARKAAELESKLLSGQRKEFFELGFMAGVKFAKSIPATLEKGEAYWKNRCELAEKYISESPCDPDIYPQQLKAYQAWQESLCEQPEAKRTEFEQVERLKTALERIANRTKNDDLFESDREIALKALNSLKQ